MDDDFDGTDPVLTSYIAAILYYLEPNPNPPSMPIAAAAIAIGRILPEQVRHLRHDRPARRRLRANPPVRHAHRPGWSGAGRRLHEPAELRLRLRQGLRCERSRQLLPPLPTRRHAPGYPLPLWWRRSRPTARPTQHYPYNAQLTQRLRPAVPDAAALPGRARSAGSATPTGASDIHNNRYHGFQSMLTPEIVTTGTVVTAQTIASMAAMPYDWDNSFADEHADVPCPTRRRRHAGRRPGGSPRNDRRLGRQHARQQFRPDHQPVQASEPVEQRPLRREPALSRR